MLKTIKPEEAKQRNDEGVVLSKLTEFPKRDYSSLPMAPLCQSVLEFYNLSYGRAINAYIPSTVYVTAAGDCFVLKSDERGWVVTEPKNSSQNLLELIKTHFDDSVSIPGDEQKYVIKSYEPITNTNIALTFNNKYIMIEEARKLIGVDDFIIQKFIIARKKKPQIYRVEISTKKAIMAYRLKVSGKNKRDIANIQNPPAPGKINVRRLSNLSEKLQLLNVKEDQVTKHCISSLDVFSLKAKRIAGARLPEVEYEAQKIKDLYEKYTFLPKATQITKFVVDLLPSLDGKLYFLQVKYFECSNKLLYDLKLLKKITVKKGLVTKKEKCSGHFCKSEESISSLREFISHMISEGHLSKKWSKTASYIQPARIINNYENDLKKFQKDSALTNILGPLVNVELEEDAKRKIPPLKGKIKLVQSQCDPLHVCELCHRIYKMYSNRTSMLLSCNYKVSKKLAEMSLQPPERWTLDDISYIVNLYGHTLPSIKHSITPSPEKRIGNKQGNYFFGYQQIMETPTLDSHNEICPPLLSSRIEKSKIIGEKDYLKLNKRSSSNPIRRKKEKIHSFENSAAPKVSGPLEILSLYKSAEISQRNLVLRLRKSIKKGYLE